MTTNRLVSYVPQTQPTMDGGDQLYLQQQLAAISGAIGASNAVVTTNTTNIATNTTNIATNTASIAAHESSWVAYTPGTSAFSGAVTATGRYKRIGKTVLFSLVVTCTATGAYPAVSLPIAGGAIGHFNGREVVSTGYHWHGNISVSSILALFRYDNGGGMTVGDSIQGAGIYELA